MTLAPRPRTLTISSFSLVEYKFERAEHAQIVLYKKEARQRSEDMAGDALGLFSFTLAPELRR
jgi:hypothetical protein